MGPHTRLEGNGPLPDFTILTRKCFLEDNFDGKWVQIKDMVGHLQNKSTHEPIANDLVSTKRLNSHIVGMYKRFLELKQSKYQMALLGKKLQTRGTELLWTY